MRRWCFLLLLLICLAVVAGCEGGGAGFGARDGTPTSVAGPLWTPTPTPTWVAQSQCRALAVPRAQPGAAPAAPPSLYGSRSSSDNQSEALAALNASDGSMRWQVTLVHDGTPLRPVTVAGNVVYVVAQHEPLVGMLVALNAKDGHVRWCQALGPEPNDPYGASWRVLAVDEETVYMGGYDAGTLRALRVSDGSERWHALGSETIAGLVVAGDRVYVSVLPIGSRNAFVMALRASDGAEVWRFALKYPTMSAPFLVDGVIYVSETTLFGGPGLLDALHASDGTALWQQATEAGKSFSLLAVEDGEAYAVVQTKDADPWGVAAFSTSTGARLWEVPKYFEVGPAVGDGGMYLAWREVLPDQVEPMVGRLQGGTGRLAWQAPLPDTTPAAQVSRLVKPMAQGTYAPFLAQMLVMNGTVYVGYEGALLALNGQTGAQLWRVVGAVTLEAVG